ncbi:MAG: helix-hairpin-helix domain-containing protein, partial [Steroidobacteraceae bacterium]
MPASNARVAAQLAEIADLLEIDGANTFRVRAYRDAARTVGSLPRSLTEMLAQGEDLDALPGIGADLAAKIATLAEGKNLPVLEALHAKMSRSIIALLALPGLGPKRVHRLHEALGIDSIDKLRTALAAGAVARLPGVGAAVAEKLSAALERDPGQKPRALLRAADAIAAPLLAALRAAPHVEQADVAGSCRRRRETIGDLDLLATTERPAAVIEAFAALPGIAR